MANTWTRWRSKMVVTGETGCPWCCIEAPMAERRGKRFSFKLHYYNHERTLNVNPYSRKSRLGSAWWTTYQKPWSVPEPDIWMFLSGQRSRNGLFLLSCAFLDSGGRVDQQRIVQCPVFPNVLVLVLWVLSDLNCQEMLVLQASFGRQDVWRWAWPHCRYRGRKMTTVLTHNGCCNLALKSMEDHLCQNWHFRNV